MLKKEIMLNLSMKKKVTQISNTQREEILKVIFQDFDFYFNERSFLRKLPLGNAISHSAWTLVSNYISITFLWLMHKYGAKNNLNILK